MSDLLPFAFACLCKVSTFIHVVLVKAEEAVMPAHALLRLSTLGYSFGSTGETVPTLFPPRGLSYECDMGRKERETE